MSGRLSPRPCAAAALRARAEATLEPITDEPRVLSRLEFPMHRLECLRAAATNRARVVALRGEEDFPYPITHLI